MLAYPGSVGIAFIIAAKILLARSVSLLAFATRSSPLEATSGSS